MFIVISSAILDEVISLVNDSHGNFEDNISSFIVSIVPADGLSLGTIS